MGQYPEAPTIRIAHLRKSRGVPRAILVSTRPSFFHACDRHFCCWQHLAFIFFIHSSLHLSYTLTSTRCLVTAPLFCKSIVFCPVFAVYVYVDAVIVSIFVLCEGVALRSYDQLD